MKRGSALLLAILSILALTGLTACTSKGGPRLTIYSGRTEELVGPILDRFAAETGISVDVRYGDSADLALTISEEGDRSPADIFLSQSPGAIELLDYEKRLVPLAASTRKLVDEKFSDPAGHWVGVSGRVRVLVYNPELIEESQLPDSVLDLPGASYRGKVAVAPTNGSFQDFITAMRSLVGEDETLDWLKAMVANDSPTYSNNTAIVDAVSRGEVPMGLVNHYYSERARIEDPKNQTRNHFFAAGDPGNLVLETAVGVLKSADNQSDAERLITFLLSKESQEYFASETLEYPLAAGVKPKVDLPPLDAIESPKVDVSKLGEGLGGTQRMISASGLERS